jgi:uncharacterized protein YbjT (DUF2867 family)
MLGSESAVRESGLAWTILRPYEFMSNTLRWASQVRDGDSIRLPFADVPVAVIDPYDIAAVAAIALLDGNHDGQTCRLSGSESLLPGDRVGIVGEVLGRDLCFEGQSDDEARAEMAGTMPDGYVDAFFSFYVDGTLDESHPLSTVQDITGRPPRTFKQWATAHADLLR